MEKNNIKFNFINSRFVPDDTSKGLFLFLIFQTIVTLVYQMLYLLGFGVLTWLPDFFSVILGLGFAGVVYSLCRARNIDFFYNIKIKKAPSVLQAIICLAISLVCIFGLSALTNLFLEFLYRMGYRSYSSDIVISNFTTYIFSVVTICVVPAFCEEVLFRGLICNGLKKINAVVAVFGSAFLFMIMHGSPDQTVHQFILGIILALAFLITNNLWVPILIHFFNNFIAVTFSYVAYGDSVASDTTAEIYLGEYVIYALISAVVSIMILYLLLKLLSKFTKTTKTVDPVEVKSEVEKYNDRPIIYDGGQDANQEGVAVSAEPIILVPNNKFSGSGKAMLIISIVWLALDWFTALINGFSGMY